MSTIKSSTTTTTAYQVVADTTGALVIQTGATPTTAVTIDTSQNVGIGTTSPAGKLDVRGTVVAVPAAVDTFGFQMYKTGTSTTIAGFYQDTTNNGLLALYNGSSAQSVSLSGATANAMTLDSSGYLLVGATSSLGTGANRLQVGQSGATAQILIKNTSGHGALYSTGTDLYQTWTSGGFLALGNAPADGSTFTERARINSNGNLGLRVVPNASWSSDFPALQIGLSTVLYNNTSGNGTFLGSNFYWNGANNIYLNSNSASAYAQSGGLHQWFIAPAGTAGNAVSFTQAMTLDASGNLILGLTSNSNGSRVIVRGTSATGGYNNTFSAANSTVQIISDEMDTTKWYPTFNITLVRQNLTSGNGGFGGIGFSTVDDSNNAGMDDAGRIAIVNENPAAVASGTAMAFYTQVGSVTRTNAATERARFNSTGAFVFAGGTTTADGIGITFPTTQIPSANAKTLDDYEEGNWTPRLSGSGGGNYTPAGINGGRYVKIGKMVFVTASLQWSAVVTPFSGNLVVTGLPFTCTSAGIRSSGSLGAPSSGLTFTAGYSAWNIVIDPGATFFYVIQQATAGSPYEHNPTVGSTGLIYAISLVYETLT
jgi:hypothetical protein